MERASEYGATGPRLLLPAPPSAAAASPSGGSISMLSMDDAWRDICLSPTTATTSAAAGGNRAIFLQEFLQSSPQQGQHHRHNGGRHSFFQEADPATVLRLNPLEPHEEGRECSWSSKVPIPPRKRVHEVEDDNISGHDHDRKKLRLIKNRESAAKARARKQAYTDELEARMNRLKKENAELRKQCVEAAAECQKKHTLSRTLTAPF